MYQRAAKKRKRTQFYLENTGNSPKIRICPAFAVKYNLSSDYTTARIGAKGACP
ncbi:hypothetical protein SABR111722_11690 [Saccharibacillus brassicae]